MAPRKGAFPVSVLTQASFSGLQQPGFGSCCNLAVGVD